MNSVKTTGRPLLAEEREQRLDPRDDVAGGRHFHRLAGLEEGALHVDHEQGERSACFGLGGPASDAARLDTPSLRVTMRGSRRALVRRLAPSQLGSPAARLDYQAATEKAFGMWRMALTRALVVEDHRDHVEAAGRSAAGA